MSPIETAAEDVRNALQVLNAEEPYSARGYLWCEFAAEDVEAIRARLEAALAKLEAPHDLVRETVASNAREAEVIRTYRDGSVTRQHILLHADGDHIVRAYPDLEERRGAASEQPLDYERPGQVDPVLRGQDVDADGE